ncbi:MAG: hypothetical protein JWP01_2584 [Myxococcales bacterium]|nr:hypothetical protein [Myxococcales bacterium]
MRLAVLGLLVAVAFLGCDREGTPPQPTTVDCAPVGCSGGAIVDVTVTGDGSDFPDGATRVCRNAACRDVPLPQVPTLGAGQSVTGVFGASVGVKALDPIVLEVGTYDDPHLYVDGDVYIVTVTSGSGQVLGGGRWTARYTELLPDGICSGLCLKAELDPAPIEPR